MKIRMICTCILAATMLLAHPVSGQTDATALEAALRGKHLGLLSYSADPVVKYTWVDGKLLPDPIVLAWAGAFSPDTVRQKGSRVLIEGQFGAWLSKRAVSVRRQHSRCGLRWTCKGPIRQR